MLFNKHEASCTGKSNDRKSIRPLSTLWSYMQGAILVHSVKVALLLVPSFWRCGSREKSVEMCWTFEMCFLKVWPAQAVFEK